MEMLSSVFNVVVVVVVLINDGKHIEMPRDLPSVRGCANLRIIIYKVLYIERKP